MITVVLPQKLEPRSKLSPGGSQHARCHRRHSLTDLLFQVVHVMDRSLIDSVLDVTPQKKVQRCDVWRPGRPSCGTSTSDPGISKRCVKVRSDISFRVNYVLI